MTEVEVYMGCNALFSTTFKAKRKWAHLQFLLSTASNLSTAHGLGGLTLSGRCLHSLGLCDAALLLGLGSQCTCTVPLLIGILWGAEG